MEESGLTLCEVLGRAWKFDPPFDITLLWLLGTNDAVSEMTDPEFEAVLRRLDD
jgi:hypothetical protein